MEESLTGKPMPTVIHLLQSQIHLIMVRYLQMLLVPPLS